MVELHTINWMSERPEQFHMITKEVHQIVEKSSIKNGMVLIVTAHTTTGIMVNEGLPCVETDIADTLDRIAPVDAEYVHAHFLPSYGATGNNSTGHIKSLICGNHCAFPVINGKIVCGGAQDIYIIEFDGPQTRKIYVEIIGE
ncbi:secondary thiamine-phosphate synthase enzyme YjbQ [Anaerosacchariphilus polymeriproducens]|uniref:YjbQ family protein n=1 Tax=Anaerosacchariphilus polymeriproducens TaxID=1812858 RepID=A0A371AWV3_9FIRM|nr:secondary thiamine-phosphate synthase enzyme YjbQ [Anaerosacchariphilus polymeriproducens]RDU24043.1 YjbQ family protein [Anaerosacchariphilus polymeriproducens]